MSDGYIKSVTTIYKIKYLSLSKAVWEIWGPLKRKMRTPLVDTQP